MFARVNSFGVQGLSGFAVTAEADISGGLPQFSIVGLPDSAVKEAADRVRSAAKNLGFVWPASRWRTARCCLVYTSDAAGEL